MGMTAYEIAMQEAATGVAEVIGNTANPRIMEYLATTTVKATDDVTPWCSAFVNWAYMQVGITGTNSATAASWLRWGEELTKPVSGCLIGFVRGDGSGHVGFFVEETATGYKILGGNQDDRVKISTFAKHRDGETRTWFFRKEKTIKDSTTVAAGVGITATALAPDIVTLLRELKTTTKETKESVDTIIKDSSIDKITYLDKTLMVAQPVIIVLLVIVIFKDRIKKITNWGI